MAWGLYTDSNYAYSSVQADSMGATMITDAVKAPASTSALSYLGPIMGIFGGLQSGLGSYFQAQSAKSNLEFQSSMAAINARMAENTAQSILDAGNKAAGAVGMKAGQTMSAQKTNAAARGVQIGVGSEAELRASTKIIEDLDRYTINANAVRSAWAARTQGVNATNESLLKGTMAGGINPFMAASTSLIASGTSVASTWYRNKKLDALATALGGSF